MPARAEALHVPNRFARLAQDGLTIFPTLQETPAHTSSVWMKKLLPVAAALEFVAAACAPIAPPQEHQTNLPAVTKQGDIAQAAEHSDPAPSPTPDPRLGLATGTSQNTGSEQASSKETGGTAGGKAGEAAPAPAEQKLSKEQAVAMVDDIIDKIKNPDPALLDKYHVNPRSLHQDQVILIYGGEPGDGKSTGGKPYTGDSLSQLKDIIDDSLAAQALIIKLWPQVRNGTFNDDGFKRFSLEEAQQLDSQKKFLKFLPRGQSYEGSDIKREAALEIIRLYYVLESLHKK